MQTNGLNSLHEGSLKRFKNRFNRLCDVINQRDVVCDWGSTHIKTSVMKKLSVEFQKELFVLNTRSLDAWIISRFKHYYMCKHWGFDDREFSSADITLENAKMFLQQRTTFYENISQIFCGNDNLLILDIEDKHFYDYIASEVKIPIKYNKQRKNERDINELPTDVISKINEIVNDLFLDCGGISKDTKLTLDSSINKNLLKFKNNIG